MAHIHTQSGQYDLTVSLYIVRLGQGLPRVLVHRHKTLGVWMQPGGHVELDETPWSAAAHELVEETGYDLDQCQVLEPAVRIRSTGPGDDVHPQPLCVRSVPLGQGLAHRHTDLAYGLVTSEDPRHALGAGESSELMWLDRDGLVALPPEETFENVRQTYLFMLDEVLGSWEPVPASAYPVVGPQETKPRAVQGALSDLFGALEWDGSYDYKAARGRGTTAEGDW